MPSKPCQFALLLVAFAVSAFASVDAQEQSRPAAKASKSLPEAKSDKLPKVTQELVDDMTRDWGTVVPAGREKDFQRQLDALLQAYRANDREAWERLNQAQGVRSRTFETERAAFAGGSMKFIGDIDGFETNAGRRIRCFYPVDERGQRVGTDFHYIVTGLDRLTEENVVYIVESGTGTLETPEGVRAAMQHLSEKHSLQPTIKPKSDGSRSSKPKDSQTSAGKKSSGRKQP